MRSAQGLSILILAIAGLSFAPAAVAQDQSQPAPSSGAAAPSGTPGQTNPAASIPDSKLDAVAAAAKNVSAVKKNYEQKLAAAPDAQKSQVADEADEALTKAVTDQGLSVAEYTAILKVAENDPVVRSKIIERLK